MPAMVKKFLAAVIEEELAPIRERRKEWEQNIPAVYDILKRGSEENSSRWSILNRARR